MLISISDCGRAYTEMDRRSLNVSLRISQPLWTFTFTSAISIFLVLFLLTLSTAPCSAQDSIEKLDQDLIRNIRERWRSGYKAIRTVEFTLHANEMIEKGYFSSNPRNKFGPDPRTVPKSGQPKFGAVLPARDTSIKNKQHVIIDGEKMMIESFGKRWHHDKEEFGDYSIKWAFNGSITKKIQESNHSDYVQGFIGQGNKIITKDITLIPLCTWLGPLWNPKMEVALQSDGKKGVERDSSELVVVYDKNSRLMMWLDPTRDYIVVQYSSQMPNIGLEIKVNHDRHEDGMWIPENWKCTLISHGTKTFEYELSDVKINEAIPQGAFEVAFPPGTSVHDESTGKRKKYIVGENGEHVPIDNLKAPVSQTRANLFFLANIFLVVILSAIFALKMKRNRLE